MRETYMAEDYTGYYSLIEYAKKGDRVMIIDDTGPLWLIENKGERFHVWPDRLSELPDAKVVEDVVEVVQEVKPNWLPKETIGEDPKDLFGSPLQYISKKKRTKK